MTTAFAGLLTSFRVRRGWSQNTLGVEAGYDSSFICKLEAGKREPSRDTAGALAAILDLDTQDAWRLFVAAGLLPPGVWVVREHTLVLAGDA